MSATVDFVITNWPKEPRESAKRLIEHYGPPQEYTSSPLIWHRTHDGWKQTVLTAEETPHEFPVHHTELPRAIHRLPRTGGDVLGAGRV